MKFLDTTPNVFVTTGFFNNVMWVAHRYRGNIVLQFFGRSHQTSSKTSLGRIEGLPAEILDGDLDAEAVDEKAMARIAQLINRLLRAEKEFYPDNKDGG